MAVWAIADLHLSFGVPGKEMGLFGDKWVGHPEKIHAHWLEKIHVDDLVLLPGDISWAMHPEEAVPDLRWIDALPGTKVMIRGNHDYWWSSLSKVEKVLPSSLHLIQNNSFIWNGIAICGARLWDTPEYGFGPFINYKPNPRENQLTKVEDSGENEKIFMRELGRLETSLKTLPRDVKTRMAMTHYPPIGPELLASRAAALLEKYGVSICVFGHLHNVKEEALPFGTREGVHYHLVAADYIDFCPIKLL